MTSNPCLDPSGALLEVEILLLPGISLMSLASVLDPLRAANRVSPRSRFHWRLRSAEGQPVITTCGLPVQVDAPFRPPLQGRMLIIVGGFDVHRHAGRPLMRRLVEAARGADLVLAVEAAPWLLARAGLLDGVRVTTHWEDLEDFASAHPRVQVCPDRYVVDGRWASTGGASPSFDFMLHLIRRRGGQRLAQDVASVFGYDGSRPGSDAQQPLAVGRLEREEPRLARAVRRREQHRDAPLPVSALARHAGTSRRTLEKLFVMRTGEPPGQYYLGLRLSTARRLVLDTRLPMAEVALRTGFGSASQFSRAFSRRFGLPPARLRRDG